jgi:hypothetical protein
MVFIGNKYSMKNVLILTPDRVGSTLLQRLVTIYMSRKGGDKPIINLHELTNGLMKYHSPLFNQEVLGKPQDGKPWGYYQSLDEVIELLNSVDHYKTSRLAHYHIKNRQDTMAEQVPFYNYLNDNFYIISCQRENLFEHALSWVIQSHSKRLNVYSPAEKIDNFEDIYKNGVIATREGLNKYLTAYSDYTKWVDNHFNVQSYFNYDKDLKNIEQYILGLDFMRDHTENTWKDMFGQSWDDWNTCHRMLPNLILNQPAKSDSTLTLSSNLLAPITSEHWQSVSGDGWPVEPVNFLDVPGNTIPAAIQNEIKDIFAGQFATINVELTNYNFLKDHLPDYQKIQKELNRLVTDKILVTGVPIKLQSLAEKRHIIKNFDQCIEWYNQWVTANNYGKLYSSTELDSLSKTEETRLTLPIVSRNLLN